MAKKRKRPAPVTEETAQEQPGQHNYRLHSGAVDDLADVIKGKRINAYDEEELRRFRTRKGIVLREWVKVILLKWWFAGVICYFMIWGLGTYLTATLDLLFVVGVALGLETELLQNTLLRFMERVEGENNKWQMIPHTKFVSLLLNILYAFLLLFCVYQTYVGVNRFAAEAAGDASQVILGIEPILFGILYTAFDLALLGVKRVLTGILRDAKAKVNREMGK